MIDLNGLGGIAALVGAVGTGIGGTWVAFKKFKVDRKKGDYDIEASLRKELREDLDRTRKETEELRKQVAVLFQANLDLKHENNNLKMELRAVNRKLDEVLEKEKKKKKVETPEPPQVQGEP